MDKIKGCYLLFNLLDSLLNSDVILEQWDALGYFESEDDLLKIRDEVEKLLVEFEESEEGKQWKDEKFKELEEERK